MTSEDHPFHDSELDPEAVLGTRTFEDVLFTDETETLVNVLTGETPVHSQASIERVSDDLQEKVDQFEEREDALRQRFQEAMG